MVRVVSSSVTPFENFSGRNVDVLEVVALAVTPVSSGSWNRKSSSCSRRSFVESQIIEII
jgi:hypothetical protein